MTPSNYDVVVVGAGAAGLTAAIGLARAGFTVAAVEAAAFPGAENWSGCVYFCENLAHPEILGPDGVEQLAWERRLVERGFFASDGHSLLGMTYRDPAAFRHCYTVLRPIYDHHLAHVALGHGVALLSHTTAESLIREAGRVIGVGTNRGPLYADLVFLAEGDASHLVTREGYERFADQRQAPKFLQGLKQVIDLPPGAIEEVFGVGAEEGVAYEILLRNGTLHGRSVRLNMGGFVYTNRQSLSVGLVLPIDNLHEHFDGNPNLLLEWFENLPALRPWLREGRRGVFGAKIIRGGGAKDIPNLIDEGLAIGGAASAIGIDFPYPNFTGPATAMGLLLAQAAGRIRAEGGRFTRDNLRRHYLEPLQQSHYWRDVEFLRRWPGYVKRTQVFFGRNLDLALGTAYVWTRPNRWFLPRWTNWLRLVLQVAGPGHWRLIRADLRHLVRALRLREVIGQPGLGRLLLDGTINALRDLAGSPRANLPAAGTIRVHYSVAGGAEAIAPPPAPLRRWFSRFAPVLASAAQRIYRNDAAPLASKFPAAVQLLLKQINVLDLLSASALALAAGVSGAVLVGWDRLVALVSPRRAGRAPRGIYPRYAVDARQATDLTAAVVPAQQSWEARLGQLTYQTVKASHIHLLWPTSLADKNAVVDQGLWHVCPAHVYEARVSPLQQLQVIVNFENCIKCETCWRVSDLVDWGRDGLHRFIYPVSSPVVGRLLDSVHANGLARPALPRTADWWEPAVQELAARLEADPPEHLNGQDAREIRELEVLCQQLEGKLAEFDAALAREPRTVDRARAEYLEMLASYAHQLAVRIVEVLRSGTLASSAHAGLAAAHKRLLELATALATRAEERSRRTWDRRFSWAAAEGRQLRHHHLVGLRRLLDVLRSHLSGPFPEEEPLQPWLRAEADAATVAEELAQWTARLDAVFPPTVWRDLDRGEPLTSAQDAVLRDLLARVPALDRANLAATLHPPLRKALLAELGRRDPSLAYRAASHLWARDLVRLGTTAPSLAQAARRWTQGDEWACFAAVEAVQTSEAGWKGEALFVPATGARSLLLLLGDQLVAVPAGASGLRVEPLATLGLRGAGLARVWLENLASPETRAPCDRERILRVWNVLSAADLTAIASGMADQLCRRAIAHATSRVQFPGLFHDEEARDPIGKFGAIKKMIAEMAARRYLIETLDYALSPTDFSAPSVERGRLVKALTASALGTAPGSLSYNAGQIFGGTGYSEDDILAKFYRDAAAWRFLGVPNTVVYRQHGEQLLRHWRADGQRLASLPEEAQLFEQLAQRKALQAELDEVRVVRSRLRGLVQEWQAARRAWAPAGAQAASVTPGPHAHGAAEIAELLGRQDAHLLASKVLLLRTHARLEQGLDSETETALVRVWLEDAGVGLEEFESVLRRLLEPPTRRDSRPLVDPGAAPPVTAYADYLAAPCPYDSGDFLGTPVNLAKPRLVPELVEADPVLAAHDREFRELLTGQFGRPRGDGLSYERYIERQHRPDAADLEFCRRHGFFRMPIPKDLGGEGRSKLDYYLLTTNAQRLVDVAISLTIQANTSIGTTPILLARDKDLPKAQKDLGPFVGDPALQQEVRTRLEKLLQLLAYPSSRRLGNAFVELHKRLQEAIFARPVLKNLAHRFAQTWQQISRTDQAFDVTLMRGRIEQALAQWKDACARAQELHDELGRRCEACDLALRWIASGQISAFALTEPSAGSDTARVNTRARLCSVPVETETDGVLRFVPAGGQELRYLLDARRLEFRTDGVYYRWSETADPSVIRFDEYDYETDDACRMRYYDHGGRRVHFTDIAQLRERDGRIWYNYWELTGAKMWITNGRMAGIFSLYAKTSEGVTGFVVDRHAEGLIVGKDEAKMGQCGSPTNELSLQAVRVPREHVLGLEGRGQVNALETLNVGRAGLAMSAMAQMEGLIERSRAFARSAYHDIPDWVAWRVQRMEEDRFTAEALAYEVIGRFEHAQTKSVRMESAIAKMLVSELLHRIIEFAEDIHSLAGQTQLHLVEKRKRDARILNIYEGTNEVQRFSILKDLAAEVAPRWSPDAAAPRPNDLGREVLELEALKADVRRRVTAALDVFGQQLWQNPNLQANCFLLAEAAAWLKAADSTLGRLAWLERKMPEDDGSEPSPRIELGRRALSRCQGEVLSRLRRFDGKLAHLRRGYYAPGVRAAALLFDRTSEARAAAVPASQITRPLAVLVVVEPFAAAVPHPTVAEGRLLEPHLTLSEGDRSALEMALRLREQATAPATVWVAAVGPRGGAQVLREALSLGVDRACLVLTEAEALAPDTAAAALAAVLGSGRAFDVVLGASSGAEQEEGVLARLTAEALGVPYAGKAAQLAVRASDGDSEALLLSADGRQQGSRLLPAAVSVEAGLPLRPFTIAGYLAGLARAVEVERWPRKVQGRPVRFGAGMQTSVSATPEDQPRALSPQDAASRVLAALGRSGRCTGPLRAYEGMLEDVPHPTLFENTVLAVLTVEADGRLQSPAAVALQAARLLAEAEAVEATALVVCPLAEDVQRRAACAVLDLGCPRVVLLSVAHAEASAEVSGRLLRECWPNLEQVPRAVVGEPWTEAAFASLARQAGPLLLRVRQLAVEEGQVVVESSRAQGKLRARQAVVLEAGSTCWITLTAEADVSGGPTRVSEGPTRVQRWAPQLQRFYGRHEIQRLLAELKAETGVASLAEAEFIIDVGFGVGNRDGYQAVIEPLEQALRALGVRGLDIGGSRKVTEELHLLPADRQIGQSGVSVNPQVLLAIGISGAPQHLNYIGPRAMILAFNRDPEAPLMTLNERQARPRVFPVVGDLFETVPALTEALGQEIPGQPGPVAGDVPQVAPR